MRSSRINSLDPLLVARGYGMTRAAPNIGYASKTCSSLDCYPHFTKQHDSAGQRVKALIVGHEKVVEVVYSTKDWPINPTAAACHWGSGGG
eukprot:scaffold471493_cov19-Prasinocladus_malaysianus.AAC.1